MEENEPFSYERFLEMLQRGASFKELINYLEKSHAWELIEFIRDLLLEDLAPPKAD